MMFELFFMDKNGSTTIFQKFCFAFQLELAQKHTEDIPNICMVLGRTRLITTIHNISRYMDGNFEHIKEWDALKKPNFVSRRCGDSDEM